MSKMVSRFALPHPPVTASPALSAAWERATTATARYTNEDIWDGRELEAMQARLREARDRAARDKKAAARLGVGGLLPAALTVAAELTGLVAEFVPFVHPAPLLIASGVATLGFELVALSKLRNASEGASVALGGAADDLDPGGIARQLLLNASALRFTYGDEGLRVLTCGGQQRFAWCELRSFSILQGGTAVPRGFDTDTALADAGTHLRIDLEHARRSEYLVIPRARFLDDLRHVTSWTTFHRGLAEHLPRA